MKNFNLLILVFCLFFYNSEMSERRSVQKCSDYGKADYIFDSSKECALLDFKDVKQGVLVKPKELPHLAIIGYQDADRGYYFPCMGSLISENYVLTVAHCTFNPRSNYSKPTRVRLGNFAGKPGNDGQLQELDIAEVIVHPEYVHRKTYLNDIALLKLKGKAELNIYVRPACLYQKKDVFPKKGLYAGQGNQGMSDDDLTEAKHMQILQDILPHARCLEAYPLINNRRHYATDGGNVCTGLPYQRPNLKCQGESGSPLVVQSEIPCMYEIVGLSAYGKGCAIANVPDVHTSVPYYLDWIENVVWPAKDDEETGWSWPGKH